jgi:hypothetical protein
MILLGRHPRRAFDRRAFLQIGASTVLGLSLADLLKLRALGTPAQGRARAVILLWLWGGPSQLDTWDPKPAAPLDYRGPFAAIPTRISDTRIGELFPQIADLADQFSILRSLRTQSNDHGVAGTIGLTGSAAGSVNLGGAMASGSVRAATGAVVARARSEQPTAMPPFMVVGGRLHQGHRAIAGEGGGPLGARYDPFRLEFDPVRGTRIPALQLDPNLTPERLADRRRLMDALATASAEADAMSARRSIDEYRNQAFAMLTAPDARRIFDVSQERPAIIESYGRTRFGQSCLLARRLVEHGVPFVQVNWSDHVEPEEDAGDGGWDHHYRNFQIMQDRHGPWLDQAFAALLTDLRQRGFLDSTLVIAVGEFGRTPRINDKAGRDHWEHCYSALIAGGGTRGGRVIGESDARAEQVRDRPVTPADLAATIQHAVGITSEMAQTLRVAVDGRVIEELF